MAKWKTAQVGAAALGAGLFLGLAGQVMSQDSPAPPSWQTLVRCAEMGDEDDRLSCYDSAMRAAGYAPKPAAVAAARRKVFGLSVPKVNILKGKSGNAEVPGAEAPQAARGAAPTGPEGEDENNVVVVLSKVAAQGNGKLLMITDEGQIWEQLDDVQVAPLPKPGARMQIHRGTFKGFFCDVTRYKSVRCARIR